MIPRKNSVQDVNKRLKKRPRQVTMVDGSHDFIGTVPYLTVQPQWALVYYRTAGKIEALLPLSFKSVAT